MKVEFSWTSLFLRMIVAVAAERSDTNAPDICDFTHELSVYFLQGTTYPTSRSIITGSRRTQRLSLDLVISASFVRQNTSGDFFL